MTTAAQTTACTIYPPAGGSYVLGLLDGSTFDRGRRFRRRDPASNRWGPVTYTADVTAPAALVRTHATENWFNASVLATWFARDATGQLGNAGTFEWREGGSEAASYPGCKVDTCAIEWGRPGDPVWVTALLRPYGWRRLAVNRPPRGPLGLQFDRVTYAGALSEVQGGRLFINNRIVPDLSSPHPSQFASIDGDLYPNNYWSDVYDITLDLAQNDGGAFADSVVAGREAVIALDFRRGASGAGVRALLNVAAPARSHAYRAGPTTVLRSYLTVKPHATRAMFRFQSL